MSTNPSPTPRILCVVGPTASGKTALAVALCKALDGEVLSCDSMQIYRGMDIGTAKPTKAEMDGVPHHMLDVCDPAEAFSVGRYVAMANPILQNILSRGKTAVIAGGTGLYVDALIAGRTYAAAPDDGLREALEQQADREGMAAMLERLRAVDPDSVQRLHLSDRKRILRALEVYQQTGKTITQHNLETQAAPPKCRPLWLGLDFASRAALYGRIDRRVEQMFEMGLEEEVRGLLAAGVPETATAMQAIGYKETAQSLRGDCSMEEAMAAIQQGSRRYAKRQLTWFRRNKDVRWLVQPDAPDPAQTFRQALAAVEAARERAISTDGE